MLRMKLYTSSAGGQPPRFVTDAPKSDCMRCGKSGSPVQQVTYFGSDSETFYVLEVLCYLCGLRQCAELATEGHDHDCDCPVCVLLDAMDERTPGSRLSRGATASMHIEDLLSFLPPAEELVPPPDNRKPKRRLLRGFPGFFKGRR